MFIRSELLFSKWTLISDKATFRSVNRLRGFAYILSHRNMKEGDDFNLLKERESWAFDKSLWSSYLGNEFIKGKCNWVAHVFLYNLWFKNKWHLDVWLGNSIVYLIAFVVLFYFTVELFCLLSKNSISPTVSKEAVEIIESTYFMIWWECSL